MMIGIKHFIKSGHADDVTACLVPEPEENNLCITMKGAIRAIVRVHGKMAHGAMPLTGINPNTRLARIILAFEQLEAEEKRRCGADPLIGLPSVTFTVLQSPPAGSPAQLNVIPGEAIGYVDIRTTLAQSHDAVRERLQGTLPGACIEGSGLPGGYRVHRGQAGRGDPEGRADCPRFSGGFPRHDRPGTRLERGAGRHGRDIPQRVGKKSHAW